VADARAELAESVATQPELEILVEFIDKSKRGLIR